MAENRNQFSDNGKPAGSPHLNWDDTRIFLAVAREGTLSSASKVLKLGIATTSRRLERLESALGVRLFTRDQLGYKLTDEGAALMPQAEALELAGYALSDAARGPNDSVMGHVRLATAQGLADHLIIPALPRLIEAHPNLTLEIVTSVSTVNLHRRDADMALRMVRPERGHVSIRRLGELGFGLYASQSYLERRSDPERRSSLEQDDFIGWSETQQHLPAAQWLERTLRGKPCRITTTSMSAQLSAVQSGIGMAVLPHFIAQAKDLVCVQRDLGCDQPIWLAIHADLAHSRRIRAVADFLSQLLTEKRECLAP
ncbi:LysR family transcriptional regulator [Photobacterium sp. 1_MG-2023]|uniref:LysR family transcriptional regulator n=1 Tax=Photobacterium sp. 1_MG-2023 TaxID=3062646 RepID=UPI0026E48152|nr:LysR family transcriptional regulator [Photobacterium sp. 1_MG-2023]MDO6704625.1 LysR family transcriptional regulator [Photobacterium sp. 1_MG-2023]